MEVIANILVLVVATLHIYFMVLEMFLWTKKTGLRVFQMDLEKAEKTSVLAANQGLYNGFLAGGLLWSLLVKDSFWGHQIAYYFLSCVLIAGIYGAYSVNKRIFFIQGVPALLAIFFRLAV